MLKPTQERSKIIKKLYWIKRAFYRYLWNRVEKMKRELAEMMQVEVELDVDFALKYFSEDSIDKADYSTVTHMMELYKAQTLDILAIGNKK